MLLECFLLTKVYSCSAQWEMMGGVKNGDSKATSMCLYCKRRHGISALICLYMVLSPSFVRNLDCVFYVSSSFSHGTLLSLIEQSNHDQPPEFHGVRPSTFFWWSWFVLAFLNTEVEYPPVGLYVFYHCAGGWRGNMHGCTQPSSHTHIGFSVVSQ